MLTAASVFFVVDHAQLSSVLNTARRLTAPMRHPKIRLKHRTPDSLEMVVPSAAGTAMYTTQLAIGEISGSIRPLLLNPELAHDAVAFLDGEHGIVQTIPDRLPTYLQGLTRHAIVMQFAG